jgi:hypothetical protein
MSAPGDRVRAMNDNARIKKSSPRNSRRSNAAPASQLALPLPRPTLRRMGKPCPKERAAWWFDQMRKVVQEELVYEIPGQF